MYLIPGCLIWQVGTGTDAQYHGRCVSNSRKDPNELLLFLLSTARWEKMEDELYKRFVAVRDAGRPVGQWWFERERGYFRKCSILLRWIYLLGGVGFLLDSFDGWDISCRVRTKAAQDSPVEPIQSFLQ